MPVTPAPTWSLRLRNCAASLSFASIACVAYVLSPHTLGLRERAWSEGSAVTGGTVLLACTLAYCVLLALFYALEGSPAESKSVAAVRGLLTLTRTPLRGLTGGLPEPQRLGLLSIALKGFFAPLMLLSLFDWASAMRLNGLYVLDHLHLLHADFLNLFNSHGFWFLFQLIIFADVLFYTIGYLVEHPRLGNRIRSVDPSWQGWIVTLACYPPINGITNWLLGGSATEFPQFDNAVVHVAVNIGVLVLMAIYALASVALNLKASNLTHRGIIDRGPYRYVRHPAYVCKNAAWWLGSLPVIATAWGESWWAACVAFAATAAWTALYALRALTEEDHLRRVDGEYEAYCRRVPYRFIPGVL